MQPALSSGNWRPKVGRELLSEVSGSYAIGAKARTVFVIQPATMDAEDDRIIFDCAKSNNDTPLPMTAWHRRNGEFLPCQDFDFDAWMNPPEESGRKAISEDTMRVLFQNGSVGKSRKTAVADLMDLGFAQPTAYRALDLEKGRFKDYLVEKEGLLWWRG